MNKPVEDIVKSLISDMGDCLNVTQDASLVTLHVDSINLIRLLNKLKCDWGFNYLANLTAVDYQDRFEVVYHIYSVPDNHKLVVKTSIARGKAVVPSATEIWPTADWQEREIYDLMGITFTNHPNLKRILLPDDFNGHPLRKDYK